MFYPLDDGRHQATRWPIIGLVSLALASFLLALACILFTREFGRVAAVWPSNALAVVVLLRRPLREWPGYAAAAILGCLFANLVIGDDPATASALAACNGLEILICSAIAWRFAGEPIDLTRSRHLVGFCIAAAIATAVSGAGASIVLAMSGHLPVWRTFLEWYLVDALGLLIVTPALLGVVSDRHGLRALIVSREAVVPTLALMAALAAVFIQTSYPLLFLVLPALILCAFRLGTAATALALLVTTVVAVIATVTGHGPTALTPGGLEVKLAVLQAFLATMTLVVLPLTAVLAERRRLTHTLADSEGRYRTLADAATDVVLKVDRNDIIQYVSASAQRYGYGPADLIGRSGFTLVHPDDLAKLRTIITDLFQTGDVHPARDRTYRVRKADGDYVWMEGNPALVRDADGQVEAVISQMRDISERVAAMNLLSESEARYRLLTDNATDTIACYGRDAVFTFLSPAVTTLLGYAPHELLGKPISTFMHPEDYRTSLRLFARHLTGAKAKGAFQFEYRARHKEGRTLWLAAHPRAVHDPVTGEFVEFQDVVRDVTARKTMEGELLAARDAAEAAAAVKTDFMANMSHEIRTPLTAILGFTSLIAARSDLAADAQTHVRRISTAGQALLAIVNDVLDFSKLEAGLMPISCKPASPFETLSDALALFEPQAGAKGLVLKLDGAASLPAHLMFDPDRLRQILLNLVGNAIKFSRTGTVTLAVDYDIGTQRLRISVCDNGAGMDTEQQAKLFMRFSQVDASSTRQQGGTGLGLAICRGLVEAMDGEIGVTSVLGEGSIFTFSLRAPECASPIATEGATGLEGLVGLRVLVADDNPINRELARTVLQQFGVEITEVEDGLGAVEAAMAQPFDALLLDISMPNLDGPGAALRIRTEPGPNQDVPILAFSAEYDLERFGAQAANGFDGFVRKPLEPAALLQTLVRATAWDQERGGLQDWPAASPSRSS